METVLTVLLLCSAATAKPKAMTSKMNTKAKTNLEAMAAGRESCRPHQIYPSPSRRQPHRLSEKQRQPVIISITRKMKINNEKNEKKKRKKERKRNLPKKMTPYLFVGNNQLTCNLQVVTAKRENLFCVHKLTLN